MLTTTTTTTTLRWQQHEPALDAGRAPVLLVHGFASSTALNWEATGWVRDLTNAGRRVLTVDLLGHGTSHAPLETDAYAPSRLRAGVLEVLTLAGARPRDAGNPASGVDLVGYSLGSRLVWEVAAERPDLINRAVLGGMSAEDPLADFDLDAAARFLADSSAIAHESTASLMTLMQLAPGANTPALLRLVAATKRERFEPGASVPKRPMLFVTGDRDVLATGTAKLAALAADTEVLWLPARTHTNAVSSRAFKRAAIAFLGG
ncbi:pimeloyl-ACP methyl ester carboxylesterase [Cryobacterium sp. CAN_C3]|uniref:alpha/beta fold hydrolase n=1 Tax=unclassified Cryobacterium TaxID=2649013 RepID=UPI0018C923F0|nr:alpha/beta fold hydrolase [Cryobacterium sp. CAN_C3]MEC5153821.1 pimeloyl-ACP methyl ester carboxylesterase [Cryobacterium sp. CAN_C3]